MGASLAWALKRWTTIEDITGLDPNRRHLQYALQQGFIDRGLSTPEERIGEADLLFFATPVHHIISSFTQLRGGLEEGCIVTDLGSTKGMIVNRMEELTASSFHFIGGHPMTGSEKSGPENADPLLFENAVYVLTPTERTDEEALKSLKFLLEEIGARVLLLTPETHDRIVASVSHLPQLLATAIINCIFTGQREDSRLAALAAGGFKDTTRIAGGNPKMWRGIFSSNKKEIRAVLQSLQQELARWEEALKEGDYQTIAAWQKQARSYKEEIPELEKGLLPREFELVVSIPDRPLALGQITTLLGKAGINIADIGILKIRERGGALRLVFDSSSDRSRALNLLEGKGYNVEA